MGEKNETVFGETLTFLEALDKLTPEQRAASEAIVINTAKMNELISAQRMSQSAIM